MLWSEAGAPPPVLDLRGVLSGHQFDQVWDKLNQSDSRRLRIVNQPDQADRAA